MTLLAWFLLVSPPMSVLAGSGLACMRGGRVVFAALEVRVVAGEALVLTGPNGSGKSSLLRLLAGLSRPLAGSLTWDGLPVAADVEAHYRRIAYAGHLDGVKTALTASEDLTFWAALTGAPEPAAVAARALGRMGIAFLADVPGRCLSAGQKRRLSLARVVASSAPLWLLDEPTVGLDGDAVERLEQAIAAHCLAGGLAVVSTHAALALPGAAVLDLTAFALEEDVEDDAEGGGGGGGDAGRGEATS